MENPVNGYAHDCSKCQIEIDEWQKKYVKIE